MARVGTLAVGTRFVTLATGREGRVLGSGAEGGVIVFLHDRNRALHPDVRVRVVETLH